MSFDLLVFDPKSAPRLRSDFLAWYRNGTLLGAEHDYNAPHDLHTPLRVFYEQMRQQFAPLNGPDAPARPHATQPSGGLLRRLIGSAGARPVAPAPERRAHYSFAPGYILMSVEQALANRAFGAVLRAAHDCGVGVFDTSSDWAEILHDAAQLASHLQGLRPPL